MEVFCLFACFFGKRHKRKLTARKLPALRNVYKPDLSMMYKFRAARVRKGYGCKCLEEMVDNRAFRKYTRRIGLGTEMI